MFALTLSEGIASRQGRYAPLTGNDPNSWRAFAPGPNRRSGTGPKRLTKSRHRTESLLVPNVGGPSLRRDAAIDVDVARSAMDGDVERSGSRVAEH